MVLLMGINLNRYKKRMWKGQTYLYHEVRYIELVLGKNVLFSNNCCTLSIQIASVDVDLQVTDELIHRHSDSGR